MRMVVVIIAIVHSMRAADFRVVVKVTIIKVVVVMMMVVIVMTSVSILGAMGVTMAMGVMNMSVALTQRVAWHVAVIALLGFDAIGGLLATPILRAVLHAIALAEGLIRVILGDKLRLDRGGMNPVFVEDCLGLGGYLRKVGAFLDRQVHRRNDHPVDQLPHVQVMYILDTRHIAQFATDRSELDLTGRALKQNHRAVFNQRNRGPKDEDDDNETGSGIDVVHPLAVRDKLDNEAHNQNDQ